MVYIYRRFTALPTDAHTPVQRRGPRQSAPRINLPRLPSASPSGGEGKIGAEIFAPGTRRSRVAIPPGSSSASSRITVKRALDDRRRAMSRCANAGAAPMSPQHDSRSASNRWNREHARQPRAGDESRDSRCAWTNLPRVTLPLPLLRPRAWTPIKEVPRGWYVSSAKARYLLHC